MNMQSDALSIENDNSMSYGFWGRRNGISRGIYESLNIGRNSQDDPENVHQNRCRISETLDVSPDHLLTPCQMHGNDAIIVGKPWMISHTPCADALITKIPKIAIGIVTADCVPILFADQHARVIGAAHAGWRGAKADIVGNTITSMELQGAKRSRMNVFIGPSISSRHYDVGQDFYDFFLHDEPDSKVHFTVDEYNRYHFDIAGYIRNSLERIGVSEININTTCTYANEDILFSYRRSLKRNEPDFGRQMSAIVLHE